MNGVRRRGVGARQPEHQQDRECRERWQGPSHRGDPFPRPARFGGSFLGSLAPRPRLNARNESIRGVFPPTYGQVGTFLSTLQESSRVIWFGIPADDATVTRRALRSSPTREARPRSWGHDPHDTALAVPNNLAGSPGCSRPWRRARWCSAWSRCSSRPGSRSSLDLGGPAVRGSHPVRPASMLSTTYFRV